MNDAAATTTNAPDAQRAGAAPLFAPLTLRELTLRNRVVVSPMQMYSAHDGIVGDWHLVHLGRFALGGAGLVIVEATAVCPEGRSTLHDNGLWNEAQADAFARITAFLRANGAASAIQLQHAGRKASSQAPWDGFGPLGERDAARGEAPWQPWGPTRAGWSDAHPATRPIGEAEVGYLLERYTHATRLALRAGFDAVEIHAAHGYLLHSFLSPLSNTRGDAYGGDREGRMRLPLQVAAAVRAAWPAGRPLFFRMSTVDGVGIGWSLDDSVELARRLRAQGVDVVDCSSGGMNLPVRREPRGARARLPGAVRARAAQPVGHRDDGGGPDPHAGARQRGDRRRRRGSGRAGPRAPVEPELGGAGRRAARQRSGLAHVAAPVRLVAAPARPARGRGRAAVIESDVVVSATQGPRAAVVPA